MNETFEFCWFCISIGYITYFCTDFENSLTLLLSLWKGYYYLAISSWFEVFGPSISAKTCVLHYVQYSQGHIGPQD